MTEAVQRVMGINCKGDRAYEAVCEGRVVLDGFTERLTMPAALEAGERLLSFIEDVKNELGRVRPTKIVILLPETQERGTTHQRHMPRIMTETLIRVAAEQDGVPVELTHRATVRSRLGLGQRGSLDTHLGCLERRGNYWTTGRGLAALAAASGSA